MIFCLFSRTLRQEPSMAKQALYYYSTQDYPELFLLPLNNIFPDSAA